MKTNVLHTFNIISLARRHLTKYRISYKKVSNCIHFFKNMFKNLHPGSRLETLYRHLTKDCHKLRWRDNSFSIDVKNIFAFLSSIHLKGTSRVKYRNSSQSSKSLKEWYGFGRLRPRTIPFF